MFSISRIKAVGPDDDDDDDDDDELFLWYGWLTKGLISSRDYCRRSSPSQISDMPQAGFGPAWNLSSGFWWVKLCSSDNYYITTPQNNTIIFLPV